MVSTSNDISNDDMLVCNIVNITLFSKNILKIFAALNYRNFVPANYMAFILLDKILKYLPHFESLVPNFKPFLCLRKTVSIPFLPLGFNS